MATLPPAAGVAKLTFHQTMDSRSFGTHLHFSHGSGAAWTLSDLNALTAGMSGAWNAGIAPLLNGDISLTATEAIDLTTAMGAVSIDSTIHPGSAGTIDTLPPNVVARTTFLVPFRYRGGRPGVFQSGIDASKVVPTNRIRWTDAEVAAITAAWTFMVLEFPPAISVGTGPLHSVFVSYSAGHTVRPFPLILPITAVETQVRLCSQRKRLGPGIAG